jgi:MFS family permease
MSGASSPRYVFTHKSPGSEVDKQKTFPSLAVMRALQGIASAPLETLVTSSVSDMYFVHQRGTRLSIWGMMLASGVLLGYVKLQGTSAERGMDF